MLKLQPGDPDTESRDLIAENLKQLKTLFPEAWIEGRIDFAVLKQLLGGAVDDTSEKYGLNWRGRRNARQRALSPSTGTLRPCFEESVDWETTRNVLVEGDNLDVLKLLQKPYAGRVKMIYIDPPYNTGNDFVYRDTFQDSTNSYLELTGQASDGVKQTSNPESSGRFHTDWLNMMYPRLKLARSLLRTDGVIFLSIDDVEVANLRLICDDIFGGENFVAELIWEGANKNDARQIGTVHEYVLVYARDRDALPREWALRKEGVEPVLKEVARLKEKYGTDYAAASEDLAGWFRAMKATASFSHRRFRNIDERGAYKEDDPTAPGGRRFELRDSRNGRVIPLRRNRGWGFDQNEFDRLVAENRISFVTENSIMVRRYLHETAALTPPSVFYQPARSASERLARLMGENVFDFPKDESVLAKFVEMATAPTDGDIVLDFFAGSGTTGHAVWNLNQQDGGNRRFILVQLPEKLEHTEYRTLAAITSERLRRAGYAIGRASPPFAGDLGFRVFRLASSNVRAWQTRATDLDQALLDLVDNIAVDRSDDDILYELILKRGLDLSAPVERRTIAGKNIYSVSSGALFVCLTQSIGIVDAELIANEIAAWRATLPAAETMCIFRDSAFADDVAKATLIASFGQRGLSNVRSL